MGKPFARLGLPGFSLSLRQQTWVAVSLDVDIFDVYSVMITVYLFICYVLVI